MAHQRKLIRKAVEDALKAANTVAGARVFGNRARQIMPKEIPCILVYTKNETAEVFVESPREYQRHLALSLELVAQAEKEEDLDDVLDDFCEQVERAMFVDETFGKLATDTLLVDTEIEILTEGVNPVGAAKLTFSIPYTQQLPDGLDLTLDDLARIDVKIDPASDDQTSHEMSEDLITVPTP